MINKLKNWVKPESKKNFANDIVVANELPQTSKNNLESLPEIPKLEKLEKPDFDIALDMKYDINRERFLNYCGSATFVGIPEYKRIIFQIVSFEKKRPYGVEHPNFFGVESYS